MRTHGRRRPGRTLLALAILGIAIPRGAAVAAEAETAKPAKPATAVPAAKAERPTRKIKLDVEKWTWTPSTIKVRRGTHVVLDLYSRDASRAFELKAFGVKASLPEGESVRVEFDADRSGTFPWRCARPCGDGCAKLKGNLIVEE